MRTPFLISNFHFSRHFMATETSRRIRERNFGNAKPANNLLFSEEAKCVKVKSRSIPRTIHFREFCD